jgi:CCR4-NOT transcription complex subunit 4
MFLHEPGEENDSFTRQDLSMMNSIQTQQPALASGSVTAPPPHQGAPIAAAPMDRQDSTDSGSDAPGLPATASWGNKAVLERCASRSTSASNASPMTTNAVPVQAPKPTKVDEPKNNEKAAPSSPSPTPEPAPVARLPKSRASGLEDLLKSICDPNFKFVFSGAGLSDEELKGVIEFPQIIDPDGGAKRRAKKEKEKEAAKQREVEAEAQAEAQATLQAPVMTEREDINETTAGGSLQLGGEPEERHDTHGSQHVIGAPGQHGLGGGLLGQSPSLAEDFSNLGLNTRGITPQQQQLLLSNFKSGAPPSAGLLSNFSTNQVQQQNHGQAGSAHGHTRHTSRFSFANDSASASASVQPVANQKLMNQQSAMMPKNAGHFNQLSQHQQPLGGQFYTSGVQGPPPGLKATGTPPVSGGGMFSQGHGFGTTYGGASVGRNSNDAMYQDLIRGRNIDGTQRGVPDAGKRESMFPSFLHHPTTSTPSPAPGLHNFPYGPSPGAYQDSGSQKSKKKGKKHRHANTSSSGGGGVVDVHDPSILQARLHQGGGMIGQGLYGQGQGGFTPVYTNNNNNNNNYGGGAGRW